MAAPAPPGGAPAVGGPAAARRPAKVPHLLHSVRSNIDSLLTPSQLNTKIFLPATANNAVIRRDILAKKKELANCLEQNVCDAVRQSPYSSWEKDLRTRVSGLIKRHATTVYMETLMQSLFLVALKLSRDANANVDVKLNLDPVMNPDVRPYVRMLHDLNLLGIPVGNATLRAHVNVYVDCDVVGGNGIYIGPSYREMCGLHPGTMNPWVYSLDRQTVTHQFKDGRVFIRQPMIAACYSGVYNDPVVGPTLYQHLDGCGVDSIIAVEASPTVLPVTPNLLAEEVYTHDTIPASLVYDTMIPYHLPFPVRMLYRLRNARTVVQPVTCFYSPTWVQSVLAQMAGSPVNQYNYTDMRDRFARFITDDEAFSAAVKILGFDIELLITFLTSKVVELKAQSALVTANHLSVQRPLDGVFAKSISYVDALQRTHPTRVWKQPSVSSSFPGLLYGFALNPMVIGAVGVMCFYALRPRRQALLPPITASVPSLVSRSVECATAIASSACTAANHVLSVCSVRSVCQLITPLCAVLQPIKSHVLPMVSAMLSRCSSGVSTLMLAYEEAVWSTSNRLSMGGVAVLNQYMREYLPEIYTNDNNACYVVMYIGFCSWVGSTLCLWASSRHFLSSFATSYALVGAPLIEEGISHLTGIGPLFCVFQWFWEGYAYQDALPQWLNRGLSIYARHRSPLLFAVYQHLLNNWLAVSAMPQQCNMLLSPALLNKLPPEDEYQLYNDAMLKCKTVNGMVLKATKTGLTRYTPYITTPIPQYFFHRNTNYLCPERRLRFRGREIKTTADLIELSAILHPDPRFDGKLWMLYNCRTTAVWAPPKKDYAYIHFIVAVLKIAKPLLDANGNPVYPDLALWQSDKLMEAMEVYLKLFTNRAHMPWAEAFSVWEAHQREDGKWGKYSSYVDIYLDLPLNGRRLRNAANKTEVMSKKDEVLLSKIRSKQVPRPIDNVHPLASLYTGPLDYMIAAWLKFDPSSFDDVTPEDRFKKYSVAGFDNVYLFPALGWKEDDLSEAMSLVMSQEHALGLFTHGDDALLILKAGIDYRYFELDLSSCDRSITGPALEFEEELFRRLMDGFEPTYQKALEVSKLVARSDRILGDFRVEMVDIHGVPEGQRPTGSTRTSLGNTILSAIPYIALHLSDVDWMTITDADLVQQFSFFGFVIKARSQVGRVNRWNKTIPPSFLKGIFIKHLKSDRISYMWVRLPSLVLKMSKSLQDPALSMRRRKETITRNVGDNRLMTSMALTWSSFQLWPGLQTFIERAAALADPSTIPERPHQWIGVEASGTAVKLDLGLCVGVLALHYDCSKDWVVSFLHDLPACGLHEVLDHPMCAVMAERDY